MNDSERRHPLARAWDDPDVMATAHALADYETRIGRLAARYGNVEAQRLVIETLARVGKHSSLARVMLHLAEEREP